jgi:peptidoglycan/xylan/chitin deacetylase (PgdA/CDA1 family)
MIELHNDIKRTEDAIEKVTGKKPAILRTPYGETDENVIAGAHKDGYSIVLWSIDTLDWSQKDRENIANNVLSNIRNGDIILMHSGQGNKETVEALPVIINKLQEKGYNIVDLETLLGIKAYQ